MKFARFYLKAYGPFRDRVIDLPTVAGKDLHIIFGPNEAGKSTILRAVTGFLFGIPERTNDAFLHDYNALRVGATLLLPDGNRLSAIRRKARKATLFAIDERTGNEITDRPLEDQTISAILGGLDQTLYQNLFGLDLTGLVAGSEELLRGEGEVGRSLFQAAAGLSSLRSLISGLDEDATALFKPRGSTSRINRAFTEFDQQKRVLKDSTVRSYAWESLEREYRQAEAKHAQVRDTLRGKRAEQQRLERIRANLPLVAERVTKQVELDQLKQVPVLPADAAQRRIASQERLRGANEAAVAADAQVTQVNIELADVVVRETLLDHATPIEQAFHGAGDYRTAREAIPRVNSQQATAIAQIRGLLDEIDPSCDLGQAPAILPKQTLAARVQSLVEDQSRLTGLDEQLDAQARTKRAALERLGSRLAKLPQPVSLGDLELSLRSVANVPDLEARRHKLDGEIADLDGRLQNDAAALWNGSLPEILALTVPLPETAASFEADFSKLAQDQRLNAEKSADLARDIEERHRELKALAATGEVVTRVEVVSARNHRDEGWARVRRAYVERTAELDQAAKDYAAQGSLADALENAIKEADRLADLLHADAQRAAKLETTRQRIVDMQETLNRIEEQRKLLAGNGQELHIRWAALIEPLRRPELTPAALREWLARHERLLEKYADLGGLRRERENVANDLSRARTLLDQALAACGLAGCADDDTLTSTLTRAQQAVSAARQVRADRDAIEQQIESTKGELDEVEHQLQQNAIKLAAWRASWANAVENIRLPADALPSEARTRLDQLGRLAASMKALADLDTEANNLKAIAAGFDSRIADLSRTVGEPTDSHAPDTVAVRLYEALKGTRAAEVRCRQLTNDVERETRTLHDAKIAAQQAMRELEELAQHAGCTTVEALPQVEEQAVRKQALQQRLAEIDDQLVRQNARPIDDIAREAEGFELDGLARMIDDLATDVEDLDGQVEAAQAARFAAKQQLDRIDGGPAAAEAQQELLALSARIVKDASSYARLRLAGAVLERVVQAYRDRHQGPLLQRAGKVFARITLGSFSALTVDYEDDRQVLLGVRPDAARVPVAGMSQGTRDQLFLSLRLAAIEQHIEGRGRMPVIVDDLLVQFDDDRAVATLEVLRELSEKTQVLFFTHHRHLVELAGKSPLASAISVQSI